MEEEPDVRGTVASEDVRGEQQQVVYVEGVHVTKLTTCVSTRHRALSSATSGTYLHVQIVKDR